MTRPTERPDRADLRSPAGAAPIAPEAGRAGRGLPGRRGVGRLLGGLATRVDRAIGWSRLPVPLAIPVLLGLRRELQSDNLYALGGGTSDGSTVDAHHGDVDSRRRVRSVDGSGNDPLDAAMGAAGQPFGRNIRPDRSLPEDSTRLMSPHPREISEKLLARTEFQPATTLNLLAAAWIQFEVHDWFSHGTLDADPWILSPHTGLPGRTDAAAHEGSGCPMAHIGMPVRRTAAAGPARPGEPPAYPNTESHWWDGSQIYGSTAAVANALRTGEGGKLRIDDQGLPPADVDQHLDLNGIAANFWVGLALLHSLFMREHNTICDRLADAYPDLSDQQLYDTARLINSALMVKIHTVEWTTAIIANPTTIFAMRGNWFGLLGERFTTLFGTVFRNHLLQGIPGSPTDHHGVPFSLTEEFVAVYRMHPLIPDRVELRRLADDRVLADHELPDLLLERVRDRLSETSMEDLFYSFGRAHPGTLTLHNFPTHLRHLARRNGAEIDLAAIDILRTRELGIPRYNEFRRQFRLRPVRSFEELTGGDTVLAEELREVYHDDLEEVDLMVGMFAEPKPRGFAFSDTAFRVFILMASRRLSSDRFFTDDYRPEIYTPVGMRWIRDGTMRSLLLRHFPDLAPALDGVDNPFTPWRRSPTASATGSSGNSPSPQ